jgi:ABC-type dipeptide/oligopeptide/nickel transport system ATPase subunit
MLTAQGLSKRHALRSITLTIHAGESVALMGPSGSGKSTLARCLAGHDTPDSGSIHLNGQSVSALSRRAFHAAVQLIPQDPASSLQPRFTVREILEEPLRIQRRPPTLGTLLADVALPPESLTRKPHEFSGGERARIAIARALTLQPQLLILDESLASLDLPLQDEIINLLTRLRAEKGIALLYITHSPLWLKRIADRTLHLKDGQLVA